ncbi:MAG TPA: nitroreductase family deazaflavin-dependent oxidoreductase [Acidimicrobiia bacterium]|jgi:deazaflavin-dependent oxidoreductase (nitroreductase family)|nr:nitroreductase family deazaflavin-dependent oxidoreductase [Acidimicrobiia bacterium]
MATVNDFNRNIIDEFRNNNGKVTGVFQNAPLLLLTTKGARTGREHTTPVVYTTDGDNVVVIASKGGAPAHPHWYLNLVANSDVTVEIPGETYRAHARVAQGDERNRLFRSQADVMPNFDEYQRKTDREIPVVVLERA